MLGQRISVNFKKKVEFSSLISSLSKKGYEPCYAKNIHPVLSPFKIKPYHFFNREILLHNDFPNTMTLLEGLIPEMQRRLLLLRRRRFEVERAGVPKRGVTSIIVTTFGLDKSVVEKHQKALLNELRELTQFTLWNGDTIQRTRFEKRFPKVSPTGSSLQDASVTKAIEVLKDSSKRRLATAVKRNRLVLETKLDTLTGDLSLALPDKKMLLKSLGDLTSGRILEKIAVAFCCDRVVSIVGSEDKAQTLLKLGTSCPNCHKPLAEDKIIKAYRVTESAEKAIDQSTWLVGYVRSILGEAGCDEIVAGRFIDGDEVDLAAFYLGNQILVECSDKSVELGDVYKFNGKITTIEPSMGIIVTTDRFSQDAEKFVIGGERGPGARVKLVSGSEDKIEKDLIDMVSHVTRNHLGKSLLAEEEESYYYRYR